MIVAALLLIGTMTASAQVFVGLNGGMGVETTTVNANGITIGVGADLGFINTSVGTFGLSTSRSFSLGTAAHTDLGLMFVAGNWRERTALILGAGVDLRSDVKTSYGQTVDDNGIKRESITYRDRKGYGLMLRAGVSFKWHLYITGSMAFGNFTADKDVYSMHHTPAGIHYDGYASAPQNCSYFTLGVNIGYRF